MLPNVSFVIIAYNEARTIARCIGSILSQESAQSFEVIVVDDGSQDQTADIVAKFAKKDPRVILHKLSQNQGRGAARLAGTRAARGAYIAFVDADIVLPPEWLETCLGYMDRYDAVGGVAVPDGDVNYVYTAFDLDPKIASHATVVSGANGLYKKQIFDVASFDGSLREGEDVAFNHSMNAHGYRTRSIEGLVSAHREAKTFTKSLSWLYQSGIGAARQFRRYKQIRLPDLAFAAFIVLAVTSIILGAFSGNALFSISIPLYIICTSAVLLQRKFFFHWGRAHAFVGAILVNAVFIASYFVGRTIGSVAAKNVRERTRKKVMVCFDVEGVRGMDKKHPYNITRATTKILSILAKHKVLGVFFVVGKIAEERPELIKKIFAQGHEIGVHGYAHEHLDRLSASELAVFEGDLERTGALIEKITGKRPTAFRSPYLMAPKFYSPELYAILKRQGYAWVSNREFVYTEELFRDKIKLRFLWGKNNWVTQLLFMLLNLKVLVTEDVGKQRSLLERIAATGKWMRRGAAPFYRGTLLEVPVYSPLDGDILGYVPPHEDTAPAVIAYTVNCLSAGIDRPGEFYSLNFHDWVIGTSNRPAVLDEVLGRLARDRRVEFVTAFSPVTIKGGLRVGFVTTEIPSLEKGAPVRNYNLIKQAVQAGMHVDLITIAPPGRSTAHLRKELGVDMIIAVPQVQFSFIRQLWVSITQRIPPYFGENRATILSRAVLAYAQETHPDVIQCELLHAYDAIRNNISLLKAQGCAIVLDAHNVEYVAFVKGITTFAFAKRLLGKYIAPKLLSIEQQAARDVDHIFTCSEEDKEFFAQLSTPEQVTVIPNGVDCARFKTSALPSEPSLIFIGGTQYPPNEEGLRYFFGEIYPQVQARVPGLSIHLLGGKPAEWIMQLAANDPSIIPEGLVPDVRDYIEKARVCISPILSGSGTSLKFLEYMGSGKPIVSTSIGARGIFHEHQSDVLIADDAAAFIDATATVLTNDALATRLGKNARSTVEKAYDWTNIAKKMVGAYKRLARKVSPARVVRLHNGSFGLAPLMFLAAVNLALLAHVPLLSSVAGVLLLFVLPGAFIAERLYIPRTNFWQDSIHVLGLSIVLAMCVGLLVNTLMFIGVAHPLSLAPMLLLCDILLALVVIDPSRKRPRRAKWLLPALSSFKGYALALLAFPAIAIMGATILNNGGSNATALFLVAGIVLYVVMLLVSRTKMSDDLLMSSLYFIGLSLLLMVSMRGWHIIGYDIHQEFQVFQLTKNALLWSMAHLQDPYNACLSITLLPTMVSQFTSIPDEYIFKFLFQVIFAFMPLALYTLVRRFASGNVAFLSGLFLIFQAWFFQGMPSLIRQEFALLFFGLLLATLFDLSLRKGLRFGLLCAYTVGMVISHYSTSYIALALLLIVYVSNTALSAIVRMFTKHSAGEWHITKHISLTYMVFFVGVLFLWNSPITHTASNFTNFLDRSSSNIAQVFSRETLINAANKVFFPPNVELNVDEYSRQKTISFREEFPTLAYYADQAIADQRLTAANFADVPTQIGEQGNAIAANIFRFLKIIVNDVFILAGLVMLLFAWRKGEFKSSEFVLLIASGFVLLLLLFTIPTALKEYNVERLYVQLLLMWSFAGVYGGLKIAKLVTKQARPRQAFMGVTYAVLLLFYSGFIFNLTGGTAVLSMNNYGEDYEKFYTFETDVQAARWLALNYTGGLVYTNSPGSNKLKAFANFGKSNIIVGTLPGTISKGAYVFASYMNTVGGKALHETQNNVYVYSYPARFFDNNKDKIYTNGKADIYK